LRAANPDENWGAGATVDVRDDRASPGIKEADGKGVIGGDGEKVGIIGVDGEKGGINEDGDAEFIKEERVVEEC